MNVVLLADVGKDYMEWIRIYCGNSEKIFDIYRKKTYTVINGDGAVGAVEEKFGFDDKCSNILGIS